MLRFCKDIFKETNNYTSIDYYTKTIILNDIKIELELWDTAGQERFRSIIKEYFRKADGALLVYDMTNLETFYKLSGWLDVLREVKEESTIFVVGNKVDLQHQNQVSRSTVEDYTLKEKLEFYETSAKNNENVDEVFKNLALKVLERKRISPFYKVLLNDEAKSENPTEMVTDSCKQETEVSLPPIIHLEDDFENIHWKKLTVEKPKLKKKSCC